MRNRSIRTLEDQAWRALRPRLDEAMPKKRRRLPFGLLLLLLAGAACVAFGYLVLKQQPDEQLPQIPLAAAERSLSENPKAPGAKETAPPALPAPAKSGAEQTIYPNRSKQATVTGLATGAPEQTSQEIAVVAVTGLATGEPEQTSQEIAAVADAGANKQSTRVTAALPLRSTTLRTTPTICTQQQEAYQHPPIQPVQPSQSKPVFWTGVHAGWYNVPRPDFGGLQTGVEWPARNRRWGFRTGLGYRFEATRGYETSSLVGADTNDANFESIGVANNLFDSSAVSKAEVKQLEVLAKQKHYVELPAYAFWQPNKLLRFFAGGSVAYLAGLQLQNEARVNQSKLVSLRNNKQLAKEILQQEQRWQASIAIGAGYRLGKHWEIQFLQRYAQNFGESDAAPDQSPSQFSAVDPPLPSDSAPELHWNFSIGVGYFWN